MTRRLGAEFLGTAFLLLAIVGSGISASTDGVASAQLFQHAVVVGAALGALILTFGPVSGAHLNPAVTLLDAAFDGLSRRLAGGYVAAQVGGAMAGTMLANVLFGAPAVALGGTDRTGAALAASEVVATFGLLVVIFGTVRSGSTAGVATAVGSYIGAAIYFTSSAAFANPAVTVARSLTDTWTGIAPGGVLPFLAAQLVGTGLAWLAVRWLFDPDRDEATDVVVPQDQPAPAATAATPSGDAS